MGRLRAPHRRLQRACKVVIFAAPGTSATKELRFFRRFLDSCFQIGAVIYFCTMPAQNFIDIFAAKDRVTRLLRETGGQPYSGILMNSQIPEGVLETVLDLLEKEHKVKIKQPESATAETIYQPVSGSWLSATGR